MKTRVFYPMVCLLAAFSLLFFGCEKQDIQEQEDLAATERITYQYLDQNGDLQNFTILDESTLIYKNKEGRREAVDLEELRAEQGSNLEERSGVSLIAGRLENDFRGKLTIRYQEHRGTGTAHWKLREDVTIKGDIVCVNKVRDQIILQIMITESTAGDPFAPGQSIVTTVRDRGNGGRGLKDQIAKVMLIYARQDECLNPFLPDVNDLIGYDDSKGNIKTR